MNKQIFCGNCGNKMSITDKFCGHCGNETTQKHKVYKENKHEILATIKNDGVEYFSVSPRKLAILFIVTFGMYQFYWFYKNWEAIKINGNEKISPFWRTVFTPIYCYSLFKRIFVSAKKLGQEYRNIIPLTIVYIILMFFPIYSYNLILILLLFLFKFFSVTALITVQKAINFNNSKIVKNYTENDHFVGLEKTILVVGGIFFVIYILFVSYVMNLPINKELYLVNPF